jgi:hypothetical protein
VCYNYLIFSSVESHKIPNFLSLLVGLFIYFSSLINKTIFTHISDTCKATYTIQVGRFLYPLEILSVSPIDILSPEKFLWTYNFTNNIWGFLELIHWPQDKNFSLLYYNKLNWIKLDDPNKSRLQYSEWFCHLKLYHL